jgi:hypothetical protein
MSRDAGSVNHAHPREHEAGVAALFTSDLLIAPLSSRVLAVGARIHRPVLESAHSETAVAGFKMPVPS